MDGSPEMARDASRDQKTALQTAPGPAATAMVYAGAMRLLNMVLPKRNITACRAIPRTTSGVKHRVIRTV